MKKNWILIGLILIAMLMGGCTQKLEKQGSGEVEHSIPEPPNLHEPEPVCLPEKLSDVCNGGTIAIDSDTDSARYKNCVVTIKTSGIEITRSEFINSQIFFESVSDVVFSDSVVGDYQVYEESAINVYDSENITFKHNHIKNNTIGVSVAESQGLKFENNIFENNYQHNALAMYKSSGEVFDNLFKHNHPHGILVHFVLESGNTTVLIHDNIFSMNTEDAINFEDWTNAKDESKIYNNVITRTNWAGINVEYNSWGANILIENNYINENGYPREGFPENLLKLSEWTDGWRHGIKLEDSSDVTVKNNTILDNDENGIDIRNCRNITLQENTITGNDIGIFVGGPSSGSFTRDVSPLLEEDAAPSGVVYKDNYVFENNENMIEENE